MAVVLQTFSIGRTALVFIVYLIICRLKSWIMKDSGDWCRGLILDCIDYDTRYQSFFYSTKPKYTFADGEVLLISKHVG